MERYFCIFSELGTIRKDFKFEELDDYFSFILANKNSILWAKLIDVYSGETVDEYHDINNIDFQTTKIDIPDSLMKNVESLMLINRQQLVWMSKFASQETPEAYKLMGSIPLNAYSIPPRSSCYELNPIPAGLVIVDNNAFSKLIEKILKECTTGYKKRLFKLMVKTKGYEIIVKNRPLIESK